MTKPADPSRPQWALNIQELRDALRTPDRRRVSQERLSELLQPYHPERRAVSQTTVGKWEAGSQEPTIGEFEALARLADTLGLSDVSPEWLAFNRGQAPEFVRVLGLRDGVRSARDRAAAEPIPIEDEEELPLYPDPTPTQRTAGEDRTSPTRGRAPGSIPPGSRGRRKR